MKERPLAWLEAARLDAIDPLEYVYLAYHDELVARATRIGGSREDACEIVQEAYCELCRLFLDHGCESVSHPRAWLHASVRFKLANRRRALGSQQRLEQRLRCHLATVGVLTASVEETYLDEHRRHVIESHINDLPDHEQEVVCGWAERQSLDALAKAVGATGRKRAHDLVMRILQRLRKQLPDV